GPRSMRSAGANQHVLDGGCVLRDLRPIAPVFLGQLVLPEGVKFATAEAAQLLLRGDVKPEFADHHAECCLVRLELIDLLISALPLRISGEMFDTLNEDSSVITPVEDREVSGTRQIAPKAPEVVMCLLVAVWSGIT